MAAGLTLRGPAQPRRRRALAWLLVLLAVVLAHGWLTEQLVEDRIGWGAADQAPARLEVAFVKDLQQSAPPTQAPVLRRPPPRRKAAPAAPAASRAVELAQAQDLPASAPAPEPAGLEPVETLSVAAVEPPASAPEAAASAAVAPDPSASQPAAPSFEWPPSTRLSYALTGYYQGPVEGSARVQWIRQGGRYQVHLDVIVGLSAAPLMSRRMTSDGELGDDGLKPRRYDEDTKAAFRPPRHVTMHFNDDHVVLADGSTRPRPAGVQDTASQFVQLTWMFTMHPELLQTGRSVELQLALPRRVDRWIFDVLEADTLYTTFGEVPVFHVKPRRLDRPGGELTVECWFAPTLQYLPARIRINQNAETYVDLMIERPPQQAAP